MNSLRDQDHNGHLGCALKLLAMIRQCTGTPDSTLVQVQDAVHAVLGQWSLQHLFTFCMHCFRTNTLGDPDCSMFHEMLRPAYFDGHLRQAHSTLLEIFTLESCGSSFVDECLSEQFFDSLMGMLLTNNQTIRQGTVEGTGLYALFAMANHSCCEANMQTEPLTHADACAVRVGNRVRAVLPIDAGGEVFNCYLGDVNVSKGDRQEELRQYCFKCGCRLCVEQDTDSDESD